MKFIIPNLVKSDCPLLIYLPGLDGTGQLFHRQAQGLAEFFDIRCLAIPSDDVSDWEALSTKVIHLIEQELKEKFPRQLSALPTVYLCGESFGACLALKVAAKSPNLFEKLILINPASSFNQRPWLGFGVSITQWLPDFLHRGSAVGLLPFLAELRRLEKCDRRALLQVMQSIPCSVVSWRLSLLRDFRLQDLSWRHLTQPMLIIASGSDRLLPSVEESKRLVSYFSQAQIHILPHSGHACLLESAVNLAAILKAEDFSGREQRTYAMGLSC